MQFRKKSMTRAAEIEYDMTKAGDSDIDNDDVHNIDVSVDGSWMTRGHSSKIGVTTAIGCVTGKVLDTETLSESCKPCDFYNKQDKNTDACRRWEVTHPTECTMTHVGSSGSMEAKAATAFFNRSVEQYQLRYILDLSEMVTLTVLSLFLIQTHMGMITL